MLNGYQRHLWTNTVFASKKAKALLSLTLQAPVTPLRSQSFVTVHDLFPITNPEWYSRQYAALASFIQRQSIKKATRIFAVSEWTKEVLIDSGLTNAPIEITPNAPSEIFTEQTQAIDQSVLDTYGLDKGGYLLCLASSDLRKRADLIMSAHSMSNKKQLPLVMAGEAWGAASGEVTLEGENRRVTGRVTDEQLAALYRNCLMFISASESEGFGLPPVEARTCGARVIVSDIPAHRWALQGEAQYFPVGNKEDLIDRINTDSFQVGDSPMRRLSWEQSASVFQRAINER